MSSYKNTPVEGDLSVGRNANIGVNARIQGNAHVKGHLKVDGHLDFKHLKNVCKGLYPSLQELEQEYPRPKKGWYAYVGNSLPANIYVARYGRWIDTGEQGGSEYVALEDIEGRINNNMEDIADLDSKKADKSEVEGIRERVDTADGNIVSLAERTEAAEGHIETIQEEVGTVKQNVQTLSGKVEDNSYRLEEDENSLKNLIGLFSVTKNLAVITRLGGYIDSVGHLLKAYNINSSLIPLVNGTTYFVHQQFGGNNISVLTREDEHEPFTAVEGAQVLDWQYTVPNDGKHYWLQTIVDISKEQKAGLWVSKDAPLQSYVPPMSLIELEGLKETLMGLLAEKANKTDVYTKTQTYSRSEIDALISSISGEGGGGSIPEELLRRLLKDKFNNRGGHNIASEYFKNDVVGLNDQYYLCITDGPVKDTIPDEDTTNWTVFSVTDAYVNQILQPLLTSIGEHSETISNLQGKVATNEGAINGLNTQIDTLNRAIETHTSQIEAHEDTLNNQYRGVVGRVEQHEQDIVDLQENKQEKLVSGTNVKTINGVPILGSGNIVIKGGAGGEQTPIEGYTKEQIDALIKSCNKYKGAFSPSTTYKKNDIVGVSDVNYICLAEEVAGSLIVPDEDSNQQYWASFAVLNVYTRDEVDNLIRHHVNFREWNPSESYKKNDIVGVNDGFYICVSDVHGSTIDPDDDPNVTYWRLFSLTDFSAILRGYATQDWVNEQGFLTEHQDISGKLDTATYNTEKGNFATKAEVEAVDAKFAAKQDKLTPGTGVEITPNGTINVLLDNELFTVVSALPTSGVSNKIYLVPASESETNDAYIEYGYVNGAWEKLGQVNGVNLDQYYTKTTVDGLLEQKADKSTVDNLLPRVTTLEGKASSHDTSINTLMAGMTTQAGQIESINETIGDSSSGLVKKITDAEDVAWQAQDFANAASDTATALNAIVGDKTYNASNNTGLARNNLPKKATLTSSDFSDANTIYVIQYDYNLNGASITIPENCILKFEGGSLSNGTINSDGCQIESPLTKIFYGINFTGNIIDQIFEIDWFVKDYLTKHLTSTSVDSSVEINAAVTSGIRNIHFNIGKYYHLKNPIVVNGYINFTGDYSHNCFPFITANSLGRYPCIYSNDIVTLLEYNFKGYKLSSTENTIPQRTCLTIKGLSFRCCKLFTDLSEKDTPIIDIKNSGSVLLWGLDFDCTITAERCYFVHENVSSNYFNYTGIKISTNTDPISFVYLSGRYVGLYRAIVFESNKSTNPNAWFTGVIVNADTECTFGGNFDDVTPVYIRGIHQPSPYLNAGNGLAYFNGGWINNQGFVWDLGNIDSSTGLCTTEFSINIKEGGKFNDYNNKVTGPFLKGELSEFYYPNLLANTTPLTPVASTTYTINGEDARTLDSVYNSHNLFPPAISPVTMQGSIASYTSFPYLNGNIEEEVTIVIGIIIDRAAYRYNKEIPLYYSFSGGSSATNANSSIVITHSSDKSSWESDGTIDLSAFDFAYQYYDNFAKILINSSKRYSKVTITATFTPTYTGYYFLPQVYIPNLFATTTNYGGPSTQLPNLKMSVGGDTYMRYFDTTKNKPLFWTGSKWVESDGIANDTFRVGNAWQRPTTGIYAGFNYFDTTHQKKITWTGSAWIEGDGATAGIQRFGPTDQRPDADSAPIGFCYFDATLGKPVWNNAGDWVDATGKIE